MYGEGYRYGPVEIVVTGFGFKDSEDAQDPIAGAISHRLVVVRTCKLKD